MPAVRNISPATGLPVPDHYIHTAHARFVDTKGRTLLLRGVNLSGSTKQPCAFPSQRSDDFWETAEQGGPSFVGQPLNLDDGTADVHLARLRGWGFNMLRYVVTWEALEHQGPGKYDYEYMDYTVRVLRRCKAFGFRVYMDPHQDLWSRFSGGDGAPFWTLAACGLEPRHFDKTEATLLHSEWPSADPDSPSPYAPADFPAMIWATNYYRLACFTVFTMFFGGRDFAPKCIIDGVNIQDYLTSHYVEAFGKLADRIRDAGDLLDECVIGWDSMNEPSAGFIGHENLNDFLSDQAMKKGTRPTPAQALRLGMGMAQTVETWGFNQFGPKQEGYATVDPGGVKAWMDPEDEPHGRNPRWGWKRSKEWKLGTCPWALHDVWDTESGYILIPDYFKSPPSDTSRHVDFIEDYWRIHWRTYFERVRSSHPEAIPFIQPPVFVLPPKLNEGELRGRACYAPHYYDGLTLITRHWNWFNADALGILRGKYASPLLAVRIGEWAIRKSLQEQLGEYPKDVSLQFGEYPTLMGEIGTPMDMDSKRSYSGQHAGDYSNQQKALDASLNACDGPNGLNYTIWQYCADNSHEWGDNWNLEDLSLWSNDDLRGGPELLPKYRMGSAQAGMSVETLNDRSNAQLLLTRASSVNVDQLDRRPSEEGNPLGYPAFPNTAANASLSSLDTIDPGIRARERKARTSAIRRLTATEPVDDEEGAYFGSGCGAEAETVYSFLTNGARAVGAFNRPFPIATVGTPGDIQFSIPKAEFKLVVRVTADDIAAATLPSPDVVPGSPMSGSSHSHRRRRSAESAEKEEVVAPTEIYVPLVHFAEDPFARRTTVNSVYSAGSSSTQPTIVIGRPSDASTFPLRGATTTDSTSLNNNRMSLPHQLPEPNASSPFALEFRRASNFQQSGTISSINTNTNTRASGNLSPSEPHPLPSPMPSPTSLNMPHLPGSGSGSDGTSATLTAPGIGGGVGSRSSILAVSEEVAASGRGDAFSPAWTTWAGHDVPLALEIEASEGSRWEIEGQVLRWWYPGPEPSELEKAAEKGDGVREDGSVERWIRIRRKGGAIKGIGTREISVVDKDDCASGGWWGDLCPKWS